MSLSSTTAYAPRLFPFSSRLILARIPRRIDPRCTLPPCESLRAERKDSCVMFVMFALVRCERRRPLSVSISLYAPPRTLGLPRIRCGAGVLATLPHPSRRSACDGLALARPGTRRSRSRRRQPTACTFPWAGSASAADGGGTRYSQSRCAFLFVRELEGQTLMMMKARARTCTSHCSDQSAYIHTGNSRCGYVRSVLLWVRCRSSGRRLTQAARRGVDMRVGIVSTIVLGLG